jgi:PAS domain S-box-containing protein
VPEAGVSRARIYAALIEHSNECIGVLAADGRTVFQSPGVTAQLGYSPDELIGRDNFALVHPDDRSLARERFRDVIEDRPAADPIRIRCRHKNGHWRLLEFTTARLVVRADAPYIVLNTRDVTEFAETTAALRASEHRLDLALELGAMGVTDFDYATGNLILSTSLTRLMGYEASPPSPGLRWFLEHVHAEDRASLVSVFNAIKTPLTNEYEALFRVLRADQTRWWSGRVRVVRDDAGRPLQAIGLVCDITERRHLEEQVRQSQKMEAIGRLAGGIAHDFNNLLTVISGYADTLRQSVAPADPRFDDVMEIQRAADRAALLTQQLLAVSRNQSSRPGVLDANVVVSDIASMIGRLVGCGIELKVKLATRPAAVLADRGQLEQVLINLAVNARDAMPDGGVLEIRTSLLEVTAADATRLYSLKQGRHVRITVCDSGVGMPPEVQARVFEPFFSTKPPGKGTGIGLSTVYGIVKQTGGGIFLTSEPGVGTTFDVYLPFSTGLRSRAPARPKGERPVEMDGTAAAGKTVLLVEDYGRLRELARKVLSRQGYRVLPAASGREALDLVRRAGGRIDVIVTDVVMPGMSGPELARALHDITPDAVVVYMSGFTGDVLNQRGVDPAEAVFLEKPFTPTSLSRIVRDALTTRVQHD